MLLYVFQSSIQVLLGSLTEGEVTWQPVRWWTLGGYVGHIAGGDAVGALFVDRTLVTATLVSTLRF